MLKIVAAPNAFKGSQSAAEVCRAIAAGAAMAGGRVRVKACPMADGGDGTAEVIHQALGGEWRTRTVRGPMGTPVRAAYLWVPSMKLAVVEMARASGLALVPRHKRHPFRTTTYGTGQLILDAVRGGARRVIVGVGGSATTDGGAGALQALGARFLDDGCREMAEPMTGASIGKVAEVETFPALLALGGITLEVACDVTAPLLGPRGAARVFGPQKGARPEDVPVLEANLRRLFRNGCDRLALDFRKSVDAPGAGAAGGLGSGLAVFLGARLIPGAWLVAQLAGLDKAIAGTGLVITGEGAVDEQTLMGKAPAEVLRVARAHGVPAIVIGGAVRCSHDRLAAAGCTAAFSIVNAPMDLDDARSAAPALIAQCTANAVSLFLAGRRA